MGQLILDRKCYQVSKPEMELHMINIIYAALPMHAKTEKRQHFHAKTTIAKLYIYIGVEAWDFYIEAHMALDIAAFLPLWHKYVL